ALTAALSIGIYGGQQTEKIFCCDSRGIQWELVDVASGCRLLLPMESYSGDSAGDRSTSSLSPSSLT
ncbi:hypothetical protein PMAYCL1PPCAC_11457, partial [Pristionchus mayeri]